MRELDCNELVELVTAYLDDVLPADEKLSVLGHLGQCDGCSEYVEQFRTTIGTLSGLGAAPLDDPTRNRLIAAFHEISG